MCLTLSRPEENSCEMTKYPLKCEQKVSKTAKNSRKMRKNAKKTRKNAEKMQKKRTK